MTLKILRWNILAVKPEEIQSQMEMELNALRSLGKVSWQVQCVGSLLWLFVTVE